MASKQKKVAVFDIDGTIFRSSLLLELVEALVEEKIFSKYARSYYAESHKRWQERAGHYDNFIMDVVRAYLRYIKGVRRSEIWRVAGKVVKQQKNHTYRYTRDLVKKLKKKYFMLAISHSPFEMVSPFARELGFDKVYGRIYEIDDKVRFTGKTLYEEIITNKEAVLERAIARNNLTLKGSIGVGDTESDISFLKRVDNPIAFNPTSTLYKEAKKNKWKVVVERKDQVYEL